MFIYSVEEIRPGNYLKDMDGVFMKVVEIKGSTVEVISYMKPLNIEVLTEAYYRELMGVPLTEKVVIRAGFVWSGDRFRKGNVALLQGGETWIVYVNNGVRYRVKCLHELQNIYFDLVGDELIR